MPAYSSYVNILHLAMPNKYDESGNVGKSRNFQFDVITSQWTSPKIGLKWSASCALLTTWKSYVVKVCIVAIGYTFDTVVIGIVDIVDIVDIVHTIDNVDIVGIVDTDDTVNIVGAISNNPRL